jgi:carbon-monoxide dehydrogenase medium subunit
LDATVNIASLKSSREIPICNFFAGVKKTILAENEMVTFINVPTPPDGAQGGYLKARRTMGEDLALVGVGGLSAPNGKEKKSLRLAYASVAPTPVRAFEAEKILNNAKRVDQVLDQALSIVLKTISPISDVRSGSDYRTNLVKVLTRRLILKLCELN